MQQSLLREGVLNLSNALLVGQFYCFVLLVPFSFLFFSSSFLVPFLQGPPPPVFSSGLLVGSDFQKKNQLSLAQVGTGSNVGERVAGAPGWDFPQAQFNVLGILCRNMFLKYRNNCECCPGQSLTVSHTPSMSS